jgi:hypothetical protein
MRAGFQFENLKEIIYFENIVANGSEILKWVLRK